MSIFQTGDQPVGQTAALNDLVGEGKKFKTVDDLAKAKLESDNFIESLKRENKEMREDLAARLTVEQALARQRENGLVEPPKPTENAPAPSRQEVNLGDQIEQALAKRDQARSLQSNIEIVTTKMTELYGSVDKAAETISTRSKELGMSVEALQQMAASNPKAFFKLLDVDDKPAAASPTSSWQRAKNPAAMKSAVGESATKPGTYAYYQELRRSDPATYYTPRVQLAMDKDAREKGQSFYS
jgi:hypothetical protein